MKSVLSASLPCLLVGIVVSMGSGCAYVPGGAAVAAAAGSSAASSASSGNSSASGSVADAQADTAIAGKDIPALKEMCNSRKIAVGEISYDKQKEVCNALANVYATELATLECSEIDAYWEDVKSVHENGVKSAVHPVYGKKVVECDRWDTVFADLMHWGEMGSRNSEGYKLLAALDKAGEPVEEKFIAYLSSTDAPLAIEHDSYAMSHYLKWRTDKKDGKTCDTYVPYMTKLKPYSAQTLLVYFNEQSCAAANEVAVQALQSDNSFTRRVACELLGKVGKAKDAKKVQLIADRDGYSEEKNLMIVYPVRDACSQALTKIELRK